MRKRFWNTIPTNGLADCPEEDIRGIREFEGDAQLNAAMDDFLLEKDDDVFMSGKNKDSKNPGGSGFSTLVVGKNV